MRFGVRLGKTVLRSAGVLGALCAATMLSAAAVLDWTRAEPLDQSFSVETPCNDGQIEQGQRTADRLGEIRTPRESRVLCMADKMVFLAFMVRIPTKPGEPTTFDEFAAKVAKDPEGKDIRMVKIGDRRVLINREVKDGDLAQTALFDLGAEGILVLNGGVFAGSSLSDAEKAKVIDRFTYSLKVNAK